MIGALPLHPPVRRARTVERVEEGLGRAPAIGVAIAGGLVLLSAADTGARERLAWATPLFWVSLAVVVFPTAIRLASKGASRRERLALVVGLALGLYLVKVMYSPVSFTFHDELGHWRSTDDILRTGHLFHENPIVHAYAFYPGLEIVTATVVKLTGLSIFAAGVVTIGVARVVFTVALFLLVERIGGSARVAGLASVLYMANPNYVFFGAQFSYESLALPLAMLALAIVSSRGVSEDDDSHALPAYGFLAALAICGTVIAHHAASYALVGFLGAWAILERLRGREQREPRWRWPGSMAVFSLTTVLLWFFLVARNHTESELSPVPKAFAALAHLVQGQSSGKRVFQSPSGLAEPLPTEVLGVLSVALVLLVIPFGLWRIWREDEPGVLQTILAAAAVLYPLTLALRLTAAGTETSSRFSEYVFVGAGFVVAVALVRRRAPSPRRGAALRRWTAGAAIASYATIVCLGGVVVGWPPYERLPGPYLAGGESRAIDARNVAAAVWAGRWLPARGRIIGDRTTDLLMGAYGAQDPQDGLVGNLAVPTLLTGLTFGAAARAIIEGDDVGYIVTDVRLSRASPATGSYFNTPVANAARPLSRRALEKFDHVRGMSRIYDGGAISVYRTRVIPD